MTISDVLSIGYKKYKDENIEVKNGYSFSFEDLRVNIASDDEYEDKEVEADICDLSDHWTPLGRIPKKSKKTFPERIFRYFIWTFVLSGMTYIFYWTIIELYHE
jgi:hypothetical protein